MPNLSAGLNAESLVPVAEPLASALTNAFRPDPKDFDSALITRAEFVAGVNEAGGRDAGGPQMHGLYDEVVAEDDSLMVLLKWAT